MNKILTDGIPLVHHYKEILDSKIFKEMEEFSDGFLLENKIALRDYISKWVGDPLHQWSRQWEYPFVFNKVQNKVLSNPAAKILDAGSGVTFFPYFLNTKFDNSTIYCCDYDSMLLNIYDDINANQKKDINFSTNDLKDLNYENEQFHMLYCISVLEHTDAYEKIIEEFYRVLLPGGVLVVTFDISLDGTRDIDLDKANTLLSALSKRFDNDLSFDLPSLLSSTDVFTTATAKEINPNLLPWKGPAFLHRIKSFSRTGRLVAWPPPLTVFCLSLTKPVT